ncbi:hypothetical protein ACFQ0T_12870 [Kitasatospora gansuensis]
MAYQTYPNQAPAEPAARTVRLRPGFGLRGPRRERHVLSPRTSAHWPSRSATTAW